MNINQLINMRATHLIHNGQNRWEPSYRRAYEALKVVRRNQENLKARMMQGEVCDGNYGKGQG